ncbi:MAG TPA: sulfotransferase [Longimicrobiales bacterium]|nr:sulfotransferase [Longimicrobiales bacterium]
MTTPPTRLVLVIGAMKCGTTSLFQYLGDHPDVLPSRTKQLNFFSDPEVWARGMEWYRRQWPSSPTDPWHLEASPSYTYPERVRDAADRIAGLEGDVRLIYLVRNPIERIESHYFHGFHRGEFSATPSIAEAVRRHPRLLDVTRYRRWIDVYRQRVGDERLLVLHSHELDRRPVEALAEVCHFLDIDPTFQFPDLGTRYNTQAMQASDHPAVEALGRLEWLRGIVRRAMPLRVREKLKLRLKPEVEADGPTPFRLNPADREWVLTQLADDVAGLFSSDTDQ